MRKRRLLIEKIALIFISIIFLIVLIFTAGLVDPAVQFADPGLEAAVRDKLEKPEKPIHKSDLLTITELDASGRNIRDLQGLEYLRQLVNLNLEDNFVKDLNPLGSLYKLTELNLRNNKIADLEEVNFEAITGLNLKKLNLRYNVARPIPGEQIRLTDISLLQNLTQLEELELRDNHIEDITPLRTLINLEVLDLRGNRISDISSLRNLSALQELNLRENDLSSIASLANIEGLFYLNIHSNTEIESIEPLRGLTNLKTLIMRNVPIGDQINVLEDMTVLQRLNLRNCGINDMTVIGELMVAGALQDDHETGTLATLNIKENYLIVETVEHFNFLTEKWENITYRYPEELPRMHSSLEPPEFSHHGGFYEEGFLLTLHVDDPDVEIYYTFDGSEPCPNNTDGSVYYYKNNYPTKPEDPIGELLSQSYQSYLYQGPIYISTDGFEEELQDCICTINTTILNGQFNPPGDVFHGTVVRAVAHKYGYLPSEVVTYSYFIGEDAYARYHVPVISIVADEKSFFEYFTGIYVAGKTFDDWKIDNPSEDVSEQRWVPPANYYNRGKDWEKRVNIEFYSPTRELQMNQIAGMRIHGGAQRSLPKKAIRCYAREEYGNEMFHLRIFSSRDYEQYSRFILRNSGNDSGSTLFRDALMQSLVQSLNLDRQAYQPAILFINGVYWGIHNIRDRIDKYYLYYEHGIDPDNIDLLTRNMRVREGDNRHYDEMINYIKNNDVKNPEIYQQIKTKMDIENFINYFIANIFFNNTDWPRVNIDYWRLKTDKYMSDASYGHDGRWRWILYDTDFGFGLMGGYEHDTLAFATEVDSELWPNPDWSTFLLRTLLQNDNFRYQFINSFADYMNTIFDPDEVIRQIDAMQENIAPLMREQIERWGQPESYQQWEQNVEVLRTFALNRPKYVREHIIDYFDLNGTATLYMINDFLKGTIVINSVDVSQFVLGKNNDNEWSGIYFQDIPIKVTAIPNPGYIFSGWEENEEASETFEIVLTEDIALTPIFIKQ